MRCDGHFVQGCRLNDRFQLIWEDVWIGICRSAGVTCRPKCCDLDVVGIELDAIACLAAAIGHTVARARDLRCDLFEDRQNECVVAVTAGHRSQLDRCEQAWSLDLARIQDVAQRKDHLRRGAEIANCGKPGFQDAVQTDWRAWPRMSTCRTPGSKRRNARVAVVVGLVVDADTHV